MFRFSVAGVWAFMIRIKVGLCCGLVKVFYGVIHRRLMITRVWGSILRYNYRTGAQGTKKTCWSNLNINTREPQKSMVRTLLRRA